MILYIVTIIKDYSNAVIPLHMIIVARFNLQIPTLKPLFNIVVDRFKKF